MKRVVAALCVTGLVTSCGQTESDTVTSTAVTVVLELSGADVNFTEADDACVDFYRSAAASVEEEQEYLRRLADRIDELGHAEPAVILDDLATQWEVGAWEGEQDEVWQSGLWAEAGGLLAKEYATRCARDLEQSGKR